MLVLSAALLHIAVGALANCAAPAQASAAHLRPYAEVILQTALTHRGLWTTHHVGKVIYFELPKTVLDSDILVWGVYGEEVRKQIIRWGLSDDRVLLLSSTETQRFRDDPIGSLTSPEARPEVVPVVAAFPVAATGPDKALVIDVTWLFTKYAPEWIVGWPPDSSAHQGGDTLETRAFPENVVVTAARTAERGEKAIQASWNFIRLPARPMKPRLFDRRLGYMYPDHFDWAAEPSPAAHAPILRWRLEKKNPSQAISEPVRPIVFYLDPATPPRWRPWIRRAVEAWQPAFEAAGFKNAILAKDPPDDPSWSLDDVRYSVLLWGDDERARLSPRQIYDPRTGEWLQFHQVGAREGQIDELSLKYFVLAAPLDSRARHLPLPDSLRGALLQFVMTHEVGHMLGLRDGNYGTFTYSVDQVRSRAWVERMGHTPSIMNYSRHNYVAQPEDAIPPEYLLQRLGPADLYSIRWGYAPIPGARSAEEEKPTLDAWARIQDTEPMYRYRYQSIPPTGPDATMEVIETTDPVTTTELGLLNLHRVMSYLPDFSTNRDGEHVDFEELFNLVLKQWGNEIAHVVSLIGGYNQFRRAEPGSDEWSAIPANAQRRAMAFLDTAAFHAPSFLTHPEAIRRLEPAGEVPRRILRVQTDTLESLLDVNRILRLAEVERRTSAGTGSVAPYTLSEMLGDIRKGVWTELRKPEVTIDAYRQGLQQAHVALLNARLSPRAPIDLARNLGAFERGILRGELQQLRHEISTAIERARDPQTKTHLIQMRTGVSG